MYDKESSFYTELFIRETKLSRKHYKSSLKQTFKTPGMQFRILVQETYTNFLFGTNFVFNRIERKL